MIVQRLRICICVALPWLCLGVRTADAATMGLRDILQYALTRAPKLAQAQEQLRIRSWQQEQAKAKFLPSLDLTTSQGLQKSVAPPWADRRDPFATAAASNNSPLFSTLGLSLTETLYNNGEAQTQLDISRLDEAIATLSIQQARDEALLEVMKSYYSLCQAQTLLETSKQQYQLLDKQLRLLNAMYRQGLKTKREYQRLMSEVRRAAVEVRSGESRVETAAIDLRRAMGAPPTASDLSFSLISAELALQQKLSFPQAVPSNSGSYEARLAKLSEAIAAKRVDLARRKNLPQLTLSSGVTYQNPDYMGFQGRPQALDTLAWNVTLGITYNLWDSGSRRHDVEIAATQQLIESDDAKDKLNALSADIARVMQSLGNLRDTWQLNLELISLEQENLKNIEQDYREGKVGYLDLVSGLNAVLSAKINFFTTYFAAQQALAQYHYHQGTIFDAVAGV